jgi:hypothetical protein
VVVPPLPDDYQHLAGVQREHERGLLAKPNVVGVAIGHKHVGGEDTERLCILALVSTKVPRELLADDELVPARLGDVLVDVREVGVFQPQQRLTQRQRPAMGGLSISLASGGFGTLGTACYDDVQPGIPPRYYLLSCNHVLARLNLASPGEKVIQPAALDLGTSPADDIGTLARFIPLTFFNPSSPPPIVQVNFADAAIAEVALATVNREIHWIGYPRRWSVSALQAVKVGTILQKTGRTTGFTTGQVTAVNATFDVIYPPGNARFALQILTTKMSDNGDSGSLVCDVEGTGIGMLFAGSITDTAVSPLNFVEGGLGVRIAPQPLF